MKSNILCTVCAIIFISSSANALYVVDTGQPADSTYNLSIINNINGEHYYAVQFSIDQGYVLDGIQGFIRFKWPGTLTMVIYGDAGDTPDTSQEIFSGSFFSQATSNPNWLGVSGMGLDLQPGSYWLGFEPRDGDFYATMPDNAPFSLPKTAIYDSSWGSYIEPSFNHTVGVRINVNAAPGTPATIKFSDYFFNGNDGDTWTYVKPDNSQFTYTYESINVGLNAGRIKVGNSSGGIIYESSADVITWHEVIGEAVLIPPFTFPADITLEQETGLELIVLKLPNLTVQAGTFDDVIVFAWLDKNFPPNTMNETLNLNAITASAVTDVVWYAKGGGLVKRYGVDAATGDNDGTMDELLSHSVAQLPDDTDGDGANDNTDAFPLDPTESVDTDNDGICNNADPDDDGDDVLDQDDAFPLDSTKSTKDVISGGGGGGGGAIHPALLFGLFLLIPAIRRRKQ